MMAPPDRYYLLYIICYVRQFVNCPHNKIYYYYFNMSRNSHSDNEPRYLIIPAAGLGTRMKPVTQDLPKELLPLGRKPAIQYAVEEGLSAGIKNIIIIINKHKEIIRQYFEEEKTGSALFPEAADGMTTIRKNAFLHFLYQDEPVGEADAISYAEGIAGNHAVAVIYPDNIYVPSPGAIKILKSAYLKFGQDVIALSDVPDDLVPSISNSGRVDIVPTDKEVYTIERFIPKGEGYFVPRFSGEIRATGIYICGPHIFEYIRKARVSEREGEFTDTSVRNAILREKTILGYNVPGTVYDIGNPDGYTICLRNIQKGHAHSD